MNSMVIYHWSSLHRENLFYRKSFHHFLLFFQPWLFDSWLEDLLRTTTTQVCFLLSLAVKNLLDLRSRTCNEPKSCVFISFKMLLLKRLTLARWGFEHVAFRSRTRCHVIYKTSAGFTMRSLEKRPKTTIVRCRLTFTNRCEEKVKFTVYLPRRTYVRCALMQLIWSGALCSTLPGWKVIQAINLQCLSSVPVWQVEEKNARLLTTSLLSRLCAANVRELPHAFQPPTKRCFPAPDVQHARMARVIRQDFICGFPVGKPRSCHKRKVLFSLKPKSHSSWSISREH